MKRILVPFLAAIAALAAGCGSGGAGSGSDDPAVLLRQSAEALTGVNASRFSISANVGVEGGAAAALGETRLEISGRSGTFDGEARMDVRFEVGTQGLALEGRALSPDGKTVYVQMPMILGPGWYSVDMRDAVEELGREAADPEDAEGRAIAQDVLAGIHPDRWLQNVEVTHPDGADRIEADLAVRGTVEDLLAVALTVAEKRGESPGDAELEELRGQLDEALPKVEQALRRAHGAVTLDADTHLPQDVAADIDVRIPEDMRSAGDPSAFSLALRMSFSDWNEEFSVEAPADAKPLDADSLGGLGNGAFPFGAAA